MSRIQIFCLWIAGILIAIVCLAVGYRAGGSVPRAMSKELALDLASAQANVSALTDRLVAQRESFALTGVASHYGHIEDGLPTASGEIFNRLALTAAVSIPLKLKAFWRITRIDNGRSVVVWINDVLPCKWGRLVDLSEAAAIRLGMVKEGLCMIRMTPEY